MSKINALTSMKKISLIAALMLVSQTVQSYEIIVKDAGELSDCKFFVVKAETPAFIPDKELYVARCPLSETSVSFQSGKTQTKTMTVESRESIVEAVAKDAALRKLTPTERKLLGF